MSILAEMYIKAETLQTLAKTIEKKGEKGLSITISINDRLNSYNQNVSSFVSQSKEDREAQKPKYYVGNGKVFWSDNQPIKTAKDLEGAQPQPQQSAPAGQIADSSDDLPF